VRLAAARGASLCPADAALSLPACRPSHALARLAAVEAVRGSFEAAHAAITRRCGPVMGKRQAGQAVVSAACDIAAFYAARIPVPCTASTLLVLSADAKGIVMRPQALRPETARAAARQGRMRTRLTPGEKPCRKRMATLACVYDTEPSPRRPHDIIAPPGGRHGHRTLRPRPRATAKWLAGSVRHDPGTAVAAGLRARPGAGRPSGLPDCGGDDLAGWDQVLAPVVPFPGQGDRNYPVGSSSAPVRRARISPMVRSRLPVSGSGRWAWIWQRLRRPSLVLDDVPGLGEIGDDTGGGSLGNARPGRDVP
jgi:hypothetical protein